MDNNVNENKENIEVKEEKVEVKEQPRKLREFTNFDSVFAWFAYIASYLFCLVFPVSQAPLGGMLFIIMMFLFTFIFLKAKGNKIPATSVLTGVSAVVLSSSLIISSNSFIHFFAYVYCLCAYCYFVYTAQGNTIRKGISNYLLADWTESVFVLPFVSLKKPQMHHAMFSGKRKGTLSVIKKLALGLGITIVPTSIAVALLSYDKSFTDLAGKIFTFDGNELFTQLLSLGFAIPLGFCMFGLYLSSNDKVNPRINEEKTLKLAEKVSIAPLVTIVAAVVPLFAVYVLFFVSQWQYYVSGFTGKLPEGFSYAEYAREGFFQLCTVSVINLVIIVLLILFTKKSKGATVTLRIITVLFSVSTLVLISTAIAKLVMYIDIYGLTQKRVYAAWFMVVLALIFIAVAISRFVPKISVVAVSASIFVVLFTCLALCNADRIIAKYNVDMYISGKHKVIDIDALASLGDASTPDLVRLAKYIDEKEGTDILERVKKEDTSYDCDVNDGFFYYDEYYSDKYMHYCLLEWLVSCKIVAEDSENDLFAFTINSMNAERSLREAGIIK